MAKTILVVDEDPVMLQSYEEILSKTGHTVVTRRDGRAAWIAIHEGLQVDLIITDYRLPGMDGLELTTLVKRRNSQVPVIMCSLYLRPDVYLKALGLGVAEYMEKPNCPKELNRVVASALGGPAERPAGPGENG